MAPRAAGDGGGGGPLLAWVFRTIVLTLLASLTWLGQQHLEQERDTRRAVESLRDELRSLRESAVRLDERMQAHETLLHGGAGRKAAR